VLINFPESLKARLKRSASGFRLPASLLVSFNEAQGRGKEIELFAQSIQQVSLVREV
jgi:hypothetical protein